MFRFYFLKPNVIGNYLKPIHIPLMISYTKKEVGIGYGYIGGKTITGGSYSFSQRIFSAYLFGNQSNWHKLALKSRMKGASGFIRTTRSWHN